MKNVRVLSAAAVIAVVAIVVVSLLTSDPVPQPTDPSYEALQGVLEAGHGKGFDQGVIDFFQIHSPLPTAWIWVDVENGVGVEHWAKHPSFVAIDPEDPETAGEYVYVENYEPADVEAFLDWIVQRSPHVTHPSELMVETIIVGQ